MNEDMKVSTSISNRVRFCRYRPGPGLSRFIRNFWTVRCANALGTSRQQRIVPDGCIDLIFVRRRATADYETHVVGTMTKPIFENLTDYADYIGIRFAPGRLKYFFDVRPNELTDQIIPLENLSISSVMAEQIADRNDIRARLDILEKCLSGQFRADKQEPIIEEIVATIAARRGDVTVAELAFRANWSPRHLRRTFGESIGVSPKAFCRIVRFKSALRALRDKVRPDLLGVALDAGYYDQAHFIHEFNTFYGASPSAVFQDACF